MNLENMSVSRDGYEFFLGPRIQKPGILVFNGISRRFRDLYPRLLKKSHRIDIRSENIGRNKFKEMTKTSPERWANIILTSMPRIIS